MKVSCEKCSATYAINDSAIPPKGARAQCPRCKHLQLVKRAEGAALPPSPALAALSGASAPPPPSGVPAAGPQDPFDLFGGPPAAAAPSAPAADPFASLGAAPAPAADPFASLGAPPAPAADPFASLGAAPAPAADPFASLGAPPPRAAPAPARPAPAPAADPFADFAPAPAAVPRPAADPFAALGAGAAPARPVNAPRPAAPPPNRPNSDPFAALDLGGRAPAPAAPPLAASADPFADLNVGGAAPAPAAPPAAAAPAPAGAAVLGKCSSCGKALTDPFDAALGTCESCRAKETPLEPARPAAPASAAAPAAAEPELQVATRGAESTGSRPLEPGQRMPAARPPRPSSPAFAPKKKSKLPVVLGAAVVLAGGGLFGAYKLHLIGDKAVVQVPVPQELRSRINAWSLAFPERDGSATAHLDAARQHMLVDRPGDYRAAEADFEKAALLAGNDHTLLAQAAAGVAEAYLMGRAESRDPEMEKTLLPMTNGALELAPGDHAVLRARAYALAHQGPNQADEAYRLAQQALEAAPPEHKAEALLALGALHIDSAQQALEFLNRAIEANPKLQRAYYLRGLAAAKTGHYKQALADFEDRVKRDPGARDAALEIARVHLAIGDPSGARDTLKKLLQQDAHAREAALVQAMIEYQIEHNVRTAEALMAPLLEELPATGPLTPLQLRMLAHGSAIAREAGNLPVARTRAQRALDAQADFGPALYQRVLVALAEKKPAEAHPAIDKLLNNPPDGARVESLAGRVSFAENKPSEGVNHFRNAVKSSSLDLRAALLGAALAAKAGRSNEAYELMKKATEVDPGIEQRHHGVSDYYESARSELAATVGGFEDDTSSGTPIAYAGILQYQRGDEARAAKSFAAALKIEPDLAPALSYLAQMQLDGPRPNLKKARELAEKALVSDRTAVVAMYLAGRSREATGDVEGAREQYRAVLRQSPGFTTASFRLALLDKAEKQTSLAEDALVKVAFADPDDTVARRELFDLGY